MPTSPLDQLADIHLPESVSVWPLASVWWILLFALVAVIAALLAMRLHKKRNAYRGVAAHLLDEAWANVDTANPAIFLQKTNRLLRETAFTAYGNDFCTTLTGDDWLCWLDSTVNKAPSSFRHDLGNALSDALYQPAPQVDVEKVYSLSRFWLLHHHRKGVSSTQRMHALTPNKESTHV